MYKIAVWLWYKAMHSLLALAMYNSFYLLRMLVIVLQYILHTKQHHTLTVKSARAIKSSTIKTHGSDCETKVPCDKCMLVFYKNNLKKCQN